MAGSSGDAVRQASHTAPATAWYRGHMLLRCHSISARPRVLGTTTAEVGRTPTARQTLLETFHARSYLQQTCAMDDAIVPFRRTATETPSGACPSCGPLLVWRRSEGDFNGPWPLTQAAFHSPLGLGVKEREGARVPAGFKPWQISV